MSSKVVTLNIVVLGQCSSCKQFVVMTEGHVPEHSDLDNKRCSGSLYSCIAKEYRVEKREQAEELARVIAADDKKCLTGANWHTLNCGDGDYCANERRLRAQALARYFLK